MTPSWRINATDKTDVRVCGHVCVCVCVCVCVSCYGTSRWQAV